MLDQLAVEPDTMLLARLRERGARLPNAPEPGDDLSEESLFEHSAGISAAQSPVRQIAESLRDELHDFVHSNLSAPPKMGFNESGHEPVSVAGLAKSCEKAIEKLEEVINDDSSVTPESLNARAVATAMEANIEEFLVGIVRRTSPEGLSDGELDVMLQAAIALKQQLGGTMVQMDALRAGFQVG